MRRRNPDLGIIELWHRLRKRGYTRCVESLFRVLRRTGMLPPAKPQNPYNPKPYQQMTHPGERVQIDVKVVPRRCIADKELRLFQYTAVDEYSRMRYLGAYEEQSTYSSAGGADNLRLFQSQPIKVPVTRDKNVHILRDCRVQDGIIPFVTYFKKTRFRLPGRINQLGREAGSTINPPFPLCL